jgi:hypothetical protein
MYKSCEICECEDCRKGTYRNDSWLCPIFNKQICDVCCYYDSKDVKGTDLSTRCKSLRCKHYKEVTKCLK